MALLYRFLKTRNTNGSFFNAVYIYAVGFEIQNCFIFLTQDLISRFSQQKQKQKQKQKKFRALKFLLPSICPIQICLQFVPKCVINSQ